jgi:AcrR family transcriptional regulator
VDAALVHHYFGAKEDLFLAALEFPFDPRVVIPAVIGDGPDGVGERIATTFLAVWDDPDQWLPLLHNSPHDEKRCRQHPEGRPARDRSR